MESSANPSAMDSFSKSLEELLSFADSLKLREKELEQQHKLELEKQKSEYEIELKMEKKRVEQLQEINRGLTQQVELASQTQIAMEQKYTVLQTKYNCCLEECKQIKEQHNEKRQRVEELEKIARILTNDKTKLDNEIKQLKSDNQTLQEKVQQAAASPPPPPSPATTASPRVPQEFIALVEKAVAENEQLKNQLSERESQIATLKEQLDKVHSEDPQLVEQRLLQMVSKLKSDFRMMYENQSSFFLEKIDLLKQEQRDSIASLYRH